VARPERESNAYLFEPVRTRRAFEEVAGQVIDLIRNGRLTEGDPLPSERVLAQRADVSRETVRLAISLLAEAGVLEVTTGRGGGILVRSVLIPRGLLSHASERLKPAEVRDLLEARRTIESQLALRAAERGSRRDFDAMRAALELHAEHLEEGHRSGDVQQQFHHCLWRAAGNAVLESTMTSVMDRLELVRDMLDRRPGELQLAYRLHVETFDAVTTGTQSDIAEVMDHHLRYLENAADEVLHIGDSPVDRASRSAA
jgi:GntR family transcriptional regulator, transcriptional repressor for pyruvate dehydrogenase complex